MILKSADDKSAQIAALETLGADPSLSSTQRKWITEELARLRIGIQGEKDSAYYLDGYFKNTGNHVVLHDLRFEVDGDVAQIDHLVFYRGGGLYLFETKNYSGNLLINEHGEFTVEYGRTRFGIPSPMEQSHRHQRVLQVLFERLEISPRTHKALDFQHVVMVHPKAIINRPVEKVFSTRNVIKADQIPAWHKRFSDKDVGALEMFKVLANIRSHETLKEWGEKLLRQHRPAPLKRLPQHLFPNNAPAAPAPPKPKPAAQAERRPEAVNAPAPSTDKSHLAKKLICAECGSKITFAEGKFCWGQERRFGGLQYCREHQALHR